MSSTPSSSDAMEWVEGSKVYFSLRRSYSHSSVFTATVGPEPGANQYIYIASQRIAVNVHDVEMIKDQDKRWAAREEHPDMPYVVFVDYITAKKINARRKDNSDCDFKGCLDRYHCIWFNPDSEKDKKGKRKPYNKIPKKHRIGDEQCPRFFNKADVRLVKRTKPEPPPPPPRPPVVLYLVE